MILGVLAFSPLVFSLQGFSTNIAKASTLSDDFSKSYIRTKGNYTGYSTHEIEYDLVSTNNLVKTIDYYADDYVGNNKPTAEANGTYKVQVYGSAVYFDSKNDLEIGYSQKETVAGQDVPKVRAVYYESIRNIKIDNAAFIVVYKGTTPVSGVSSIPNNAFLFPIQINTQNIETKGSFRIEGLGSGTDYVAQLVLINKGLGGDVIKNMTFKTGGSDQVGGANYKAEGTIGLTNGTLEQSGEAGALDPDESMPRCWLGVSDGISMSGCFAQLLYYVLYVPTSWLFMVAGMLFDFTFDYSIQSSSYDNSSQFVQKAWALVRDLCNIAFIVMMMYIAIGTLLETGGVDWKKMIIPIIIAAVTINFSFFLTRIIIDTGNVTARLFYNSDTIAITKIDRSTGERTVAHGMSEVIVSGFDPQRIVLEGKDKLYDDVNSKNAGRNEASSGGDLDNTTFILITICAVILNVIGAGIFFKIGILFVGRVIGLWVQTITSPLAFVSNILPKGWKMGGISFDSWLKETFKIAMMAPIFMVFMYLILLFVQIGAPLLKESGESNTSWILGVVMPFIFIIVMLGKAKDTAVSLAGSVAKELAGKITQAAGVVGGVALGAATGGAALIGRNTLGAAATSGTGAKLAERLAAAEAKGGISGKFAKLGLKTFDKAKDGSFDVRNTKGFNAVSGGFSKVSGFDMSGKTTNAFLGGAGLSMGAVGLDANKTGFATYQKERQEKKEKEIERQSKISHVTDTQFKEMHDNQVEKYETIYKDKIEKEKIAANYAAKTDDEKKKFEEEFKKKHEAKYGKRFEELGKDAKPEDIKAMRKKVEDDRLEKLLARLDTRFDDFSVTGSVLNKATSFIGRSKDNDRATQGVVAAGVVGGAGRFSGSVAGSALVGTGVGAVVGASLLGSAVADNRINKDIKEKYAKQSEKAKADAVKLQNQNEDLERANKENERRVTAAESALARNTGLIENNAELKPLKDKIDDLKANNEEYKKIVDEKKAILTEEDEINKKLGKKRDAATGKFVDMTDADKQAANFTELSDDEKKKAKKSAEEMAKNIIRKEKQLQDMITTTVEDYVFEQNETLRDELYQKEQSGTVDKKELDKIRSRMKFLGSVSSDRKNFSRQKETLTTQIDSNKTKIKENKEKIESGGKPKEEKK